SSGRRFSFSLSPASKAAKRFLSQRSNNRRSFDSQASSSTPWQYACRRSRKLPDSTGCPMVNCKSDLTWVVLIQYVKVAVGLSRELQVVDTVAGLAMAELNLVGYQGLPGRNCHI
ncbi:hypothetical protein CPAR01_16192, partial [Colletotrichum paranaense]